MGLSNTKKGILLGFAGYSFFSVSDACVKWLGSSYEETSILFWVYSFVLATCLILAFPQGIKNAYKTKTPFIHIARSIGMVSVGYCAISALGGGLPLASLYTLIFLFPLIAAILAVPLYKEHVSRMSWIILLMGFAGVIVAFHKDLTFSDPNLLYAFGALFFGTIVNFLARPISKSDHVLTFPFYPGIVAIPLVFAYTHGNIAVPEMKDLPFFALSGICSCLAMICVLQAFRTAPYAIVSPSQYIQMLYGLVFGYLVFGDKPEAWMLVGAGMIIASGLLLITQKK